MTNDASSQKIKNKRDEPRTFKPRQFAFGLLLAGGGMGLMIFVAAGALHDAGAGGAVSLPATGLCMILGLMLLGGGFGQMTISTPKFDDTEFHRLLAGAPVGDDRNQNTDSESADNSLLDNSGAAAIALASAVDSHDNDVA